MPPFKPTSFQPDVASYVNRLNQVPLRESIGAYEARDRLRRIAHAYVICLKAVYDSFPKTGTVDVVTKLNNEIAGNRVITALWVGGDTATNLDIGNVGRYPQTFGVAVASVGQRLMVLTDMLAGFARVVQSYKGKMITHDDFVIALQRMGVMKNTTQMMTPSDFIAGFQYEG